MSLADHQWELDYTSSDDLLRSFFLPALAESTAYNRGTGFFSSSLFEALGSELQPFLERDGQIRIITSVRLSEEDHQALVTGYRASSILANQIECVIAEQFAPPIGDGAMILAKLVELGRLELRIAVPRRGDGLYHVKIGYFKDEDGNTVSWSGSPNDSQTAWEINFEEVTVFTSWESNRRDYDQRKRDEFERQWRDESDRIRVYSFPEAARLRLIELRQKTEDWKRANPDKWRHQKEAIELFLQDRDPERTAPPCPAGRQGILAMATGTGKTRTALRLADRMVQEGLIDHVIVTTHLTDVLSQWEGEILDRSATKFFTYNHRNVDGRDVHETSAFRNSGQAHKALLCTRAAFSKLLEGARKGEFGRTLAIIDECHNYRGSGHIAGTGSAYAKLPYRLGLSATPYSPYSALANDALDKQIGPTYFTFGIEEAIKRNILCPFTYETHEYELTTDEKSEKQRTRALYEAKIAEGQATNTDMWTALARHNKLAAEKLEIFARLVQAAPDLLERCLIFVLEKEFGDEVTKRIQLFGDRYRVLWKSYYSETSAAHLEEFRQGNIECLVTCQKLNEGVDIPTVRNIVMFASDQGRDGLRTTQRIGRALRFDPNDPGKIARVVDFVERGVTSGNEFERARWLNELAEVRPPKTTE